MESIEKLGIGVPSPVEFGLFKGFLLYSTGHYDRALAVTESAYDKLADSSEYSENEKNYLRCYGSATCHFIARKVSGTADLRERLQGKYQINYDNVDLARIANRFKLKYPLRDHPNWDKGSDKGSG